MVVAADRSRAPRGDPPRPMRTNFPALRLRVRMTVAALLLGLIAAVPVHAGGDRAEREGWILGLVLGRGSGDFTVSDGEVAATTGWSGGGRIVRGRIGYFLTRELQVSGEYGVWRRTAAGDSTATEEGEGSAEGLGPVDRYLGSGILAVSLYPRLDGFSLRAGLGYGLGFAEAEADGTVLREQKAGFLLLMGFAYEMPISRDLSLAIGADFGRIETGQTLSGNFAHFTATFQWHLPHGLPRRWF